MVAGLGKLLVSGYLIGMSQLWNARIRNRMVLILFQSKTWWGRNNSLERRQISATDVV